MIITNKTNPKKLLWLFLSMSFIALYTFLFSSISFADEGLMDFAPTNTGKYSLGITTKYYFPVPYFSYKPVTDSEFTMETFPPYYLLLNARLTFLKTNIFLASAGLEGEIIWGYEENRILAGWATVPLSFTLRIHNILSWINLKPGFFYFSPQPKALTMIEKYLPSVRLPILTIGTGLGFAPPKGFRFLFAVNYSFTLKSADDIMEIPEVGISIGYDFGSIKRSKNK